MEESTLTLRLLLGDQLNRKHSWFTATDPSVTYLLMEMRQETDYVAHHIQKVVGFFGAMRRFARWLRDSGHQVIYLELDDPANRQDLSANIRELVQTGAFTRFEYLLPDEYRLDQQIKELCTELPIASQSSDTEHFLTERNDLAEFFGPKPYLMETFYRNIRRLHEWLMEDGKPEGGRWNYDRENRRALPKDMRVAEAKTFDHQVTDLVDLVSSSQVNTIGMIDPRHFIWPLDRDGSLQLLDYFIDACLPDFGAYQDAMHTDYWSLFHSRISFSLNTKMISPREVVEKTLEAYRRNDRISLPAVEGFIRQIIGWREFMRGVYWAQMPDYATMNLLEHHRPLPDFYWTGETGMNCLRHAITQSLETAYAHHIQRLMVTGNFALLAEIDPDAVDGWYLGIYIDAVQWVEITNTRGMSQFADGGIIATKPYVSSANYINKMSNYCGSCRYDHKQKNSKDACPFNSLYWNFLLSHQKFFASNHRMKMMYSRLEAMSTQEKSKLASRANDCLDNLDAL
ncbi:MAG: cryptochrome/photolyase family protein [Desulfofustis sp.]|nr:cryptochrome/photolyase family protein [Desulfofustis sp.]